MAQVKNMTSNQLMQCCAEDASIKESFSPDPILCNANRFFNSYWYYVKRVIEYAFCVEF